MSEVIRMAASIAMLILVIDRVRSLWQEIRQANESGRSATEEALAEIHDLTQELLAKVEQQETGLRSETTPDPLEDSWADVRKLQAVNEKIPKQKFSQQVESIVESASEILKQIQDDPTKAQNARKFTAYYLPFTVRLLETYSRLYDIATPGRNIEEAKVNIENALDTIVLAFREQVDRLFMDDNISVKADIAVLKTMLTSEGLAVQNPFDTTEQAK